MRVTDEKIVIAVLSSATNDAAAQSCGLSLRQLYNRLRTPSVKGMLRDARARMLETATSRLQDHMDDAVKVMASIMLDADVSAQTRLTASQSILSTGLKMQEKVDILNRLDELEKTLEGIEHDKH